MTMFDIRIAENNEILLSGRFDASQVNKAKSVFDKINKSHTVNLKELDYISSAGLGVLLGAQKRLTDNGHKLKLIKMNNHIRDVFKWAGFDIIFDIE